MEKDNLEEMRDFINGFILTALKDIQESPLTEITEITVYGENGNVIV
jgi:hypothetical protein